ncbi:NAD(P)/FAD-dependent oxidoreductase [uncultured Devosia sp.]|uniref:FAD-dependent oxidoreductase n=1 Tax=uncultured Devosia sp. TaxID=211434 RepID=UPI00262C6F09|nr:NAD(P)/FAD-dependent oxidoreductase [uncultured Devosia sp.]
MAGAGPGGLATALLLSRAGHRVRLFERFETPRPLGSGLMLQPTGLAVLAALGLAGEIAALGAPVERLIGTDAKSGRVVLDVGYRPLGPEVHAIAVHRAALFNVLHDAVVAERLPIRTGFVVEGLERSGGGQWLRGPQGLEGPFDLVVDALGSASPLKSEAKVPSRSRPLSFGAIWGTVPWVDAGFRCDALMQRYRKASIMIGVLPVGRQRRDGPELAAFFWSLRPERYAAVQAAGIDSWRDEVRGHWPETAPHLEAITDFEQMTLARYAHHTLQIPAGDGIAFIGDSAHSTSPQLGQGANMALLDAAALAEALAGAATIADALSSYARLRRWHVRLYQMLSLTLTPFYQSDGNLLPLLRDGLVSAAARVPPIPWLLASMVSGQLLSPLKTLRLETKPLREVAA